MKNFWGIFYSKAQKVKTHLFFIQHSTEGRVSIGMKYTWLEAPLDPELPVKQMIRNCGYLFKRLEISPLLSAFLSCLRCKASWISTCRFRSLFSAALESLIRNAHLAIKGFLMTSLSLITIMARKYFSKGWMLSEPTTQNPTKWGINRREQMTDALSGMLLCSSWTNRWWWPSLFNCLVTRTRFCSQKYEDRSMALVKTITEMTGIKTVMKLKATWGKSAFSRSRQTE